MTDTLHIDPTLTLLQEKIYAIVKEAWCDHGFAPSQVEIRNAAHCSITTVVKGLKVLKDKGYVTQQKFGARTAKPTDLDRTILREPLKPWDELATPKKYLVLTERTTNR